MIGESSSKRLSKKQTNSNRPSCGFADRIDRQTIRTDKEMRFNTVAMHTLKYHLHRMPWAITSAANCVLTSSPITSLPDVIRK